MIKFLHCAHLFRFIDNTITVVTPIGDKWKIELTDVPDNPFKIRIISKCDPYDNREQTHFERDMFPERML